MRSRSSRCAVHSRAFRAAPSCHVDSQRKRLTTDHHSSAGVGVFHAPSEKEKKGNLLFITINVVSQGDKNCRNKGKKIWSHRSASCDLVRITMSHIRAHSSHRLLDVLYEIAGNAPHAWLNSLNMLEKPNRLQSALNQRVFFATL